MDKEGWFGFKHKVLLVYGTNTNNLTVQQGVGGRAHGNG